MLARLCYVESISKVYERRKGRDRLATRYTTDSPMPRFRQRQGSALRYSQPCPATKNDDTGVPAGATSRTHRPSCRQPLAICDGDYKHETSEVGDWKDLDVGGISCRATWLYTKNQPHLVLGSNRNHMSTLCLPVRI